MTATLFLGQDIGFGFELRVRVHGAGLTQHLATLNTFTVHTTQQSADVVARFTTVQQLAEHFHAGTCGLLGVADTHDFDFVAHVDHATLDTAGHNRTTAGDREHVFHRHQERLVYSTGRRRDVLIHSCHQFPNFLFTDFRFVAFHRRQRGTRDDRNVVARVLVRGQQLADFHLDQLQQLFVVHLVHFVHENNHVRDANLTAEQDVLTRLGHWAVGCVHNQDRAVHLGGTGDHVLDVVGVAGAVDVRVVACLRLVLDVRCGDRDATCFLFGRTVDLVVGLEVTEVLRDRRCQCRLTVVNVADCADVNVRFVTFKLCLCHGGSTLMYLRGHRGPDLLRHTTTRPAPLWRAMYWVWAVKSSVFHAAA
ncbi:ISxac3 transposase [Sulfitobacter noctilucae]|nr:ISxac3 transposase [Sulfitobacter noctilucae]